MTVKTPIVDSVLDVFDTMLSMELEFSDGDSQQSITGSRTVGTVNFIGVVLGSVTIHLDEAFSRQMTASMLDMEPEEIEDEEDIKDIVGELVNIIGGNLKSVLNDTGFSCYLSPLSITTGSDFTIESQNMERYDKFSFMYKDHHIIVEVGMKTLGKALDLSSMEIDFDEPSEKTGIVEQEEAQSLQEQVVDSEVILEEGDDEVEEEISGSAGEIES